MKYLTNKNLNLFLSSFLAVAVMAFGVLSIVAMNHQVAMAGQDSIISQSSDCAGAHSSEACVSFHLGVMQNLSAGTQTGISQVTTLLSLIFVVSLLGLFLFEIFSHSFEFHRLRLKRLYEKTVTAFARQLGNWLTLLEKRDPICAIVLA